MYPTVQIKRGWVSRGRTPTDNRYTQTGHRYMQIDHRYMQVDHRYMQIDHRHAWTHGCIPPTPKVLEACARVYIPNDHRYTRPLSCGCSASDDAMLQRASTAIALHTYRHVVRSSVCALHLRGYVRRRGENWLQNTFVVRSTVGMGWI